MKFVLKLALIALIFIGANCITQAGRGSDVDSSLEPTKKIT